MSAIYPNHSHALKVAIAAARAYKKGIITVRYFDLKKQIQYLSVDAAKNW